MEVGTGGRLEVWSGLKCRKTWRGPYGTVPCEGSMLLEWSRGTPDTPRPPLLDRGWVHPGNPFILFLRRRRSSGCGSLRRLVLLLSDPKSGGRRPGVKGCGRSVETRHVLCVWVCVTWTTLRPGKLLEGRRWDGRSGIILRFGVKIITDSLYFLVPCHP